MLKYLTQIWNSKDLRNKILFTLGILVIYRLIAHISVPGADIDALRSIKLQQNDLLQVFSLLTGGSTENFSIVLMGLSPYINASIIIQLMTVISPKLESISKEGEQGRKKINSYTRWLTFPLAFLQSYGMITILNIQAPVQIIDTSSPSVIIPIMLTVTAGTVLLVWLGELMTEKGIGNGISLLIFASIISQVPQMIASGLAQASDDEQKLIPFVITILITVILTTIIVLVNEAQRKIPITYAGRGIKAKSDQASLPIRINQAGMIPIIFAVALVSFPGILSQFLQNASSPWLSNFGNTLNTIFQPNSGYYLAGYFLLVIAFTYFYVSITFNPEQIAENIQKRGGYVPGIRPGRQTSEYIGKISNRLTLFGALFLALIAISPMLIQLAFQSTQIGSVPLLISGAGMIIIVGVVLELIRQVNAQLAMHDYGKFY